MTVLMSGSVTVLLKVTNSIIQSDDLTVASGDDDLTIIDIAQVSSWILLAVNN